MDPEPMARPRIFILGAGFSAPAGLPVSRGLLDLVLDELRAVGDGVHLNSALDEYVEYITAIRGKAPLEIDIEDFAAYLDYEHFFGMLGSPFSNEGNRPQLQLRWGIGRVLHRLTPETWALPSCHLQFAERLRPQDVVVTFNYDCVLERALDRVGRPYRRFPNRYSSVDPSGSTLDMAAEAGEVLVVKVHGSIDWVSTDGFVRQLDYLREVSGPASAAAVEERDPLFGRTPISATHPLTEGPRPRSDATATVRVVENLDAYYGDSGLLYDHPPLILAPSTAKQLYGRPLAKQWSGMPLLASYWSGLTVIGYSLPPADPYARQVLYRLVDGYSAGLERGDPDSRRMRQMEVVSLKRGSWPQRQLRNAYQIHEREAHELHLRRNSTISRWSVSLPKAWGDHGPHVGPHSIPAGSQRGLLPNLPGPVTSARSGERRIG